MHSITLFSILLLAKVAFSATNVEIRNEYQPTLLRLRDVANVKYKETDRRYSALYKQIDANNLYSKNRTQFLINNLRSTIGAALKTPNITASTSTCLKNQETLANRLNINSLTACFNSGTTSALRAVRDKFNTVAGVAVNAINYCSYLNPLDTQLDSFENCVANKIPDLYRQINLIDVEYNKISNSTLTSSTKCLTDTASPILAQISTISYQTSLCLF